MQSPVTKAEHFGLTWCRPRRGPGETLSFFKELSDKAIVEPFENLEFTAQGDKVVVEGSNRGTARSTGKCYEHQWVMVFTFRSGKIAGMNHYYDTADIEPAFAD